jgi:hypothetical protein
MPDQVWLRSQCLPGPGDHRQGHAGTVVEQLETPVVGVHQHQQPPAGLGIPRLVNGPARPLAVARRRSWLDARLRDPQRAHALKYFLSPLASGVAMRAPPRVCRRFAARAEDVAHAPPCPLREQDCVELSSPVTRAAYPSRSGLDAQAFRQSAPEFLQLVALAVHGPAAVLSEERARCVVPADRQARL